MRDEAPIIDRLVAVFTYFSFGLVGLGWLIYCGVTKKQARSFASYHIYQSIFLSVFISIMSILCGYLVGFLVNVPYIGGFVKKLVIFFAGNPIYYGFTAIQFAIFAIIAYLALGAILGKYSYFPGLSDIIKGRFRG